MGNGNIGSDFLTAIEAAQLVGVSHWTIRLWLRQGKLARYKRMSWTLVSRAELLKLVEPRKAERIATGRK